MRAGRRLHLLGHSHLDVAWVWDTREGLDALVKTVEHVLNLMRAYPDFKYAQSTALYYYWLSKHRPDLLKEVVKMVRNGRWEVVGGSWVESDCILPSGEGLVRQFLYGKRFIRRVLGVDVKVAWFPDSFGFPESLPKILRGCGIRYFLTQKLNWNDTVMFPYNLFRWSSSDGSEVLAYQTAAGYWGDPGDYDLVIKSFLAIHVRQGLKDLLMLFGYGDHGYGPREGDVRHAVEVVRELPEELRRWGVVEARHTSAEEFFKEVAEPLRHELPLVKGELYLQFHRGTYTSQVRVKELIKECERLLTTLEKALTIKYLVTRKAYSRAWIEGFWRELLTAHFHDVMAGSLSKTPYREFLSRLTRLRDALVDALSKAVASLLEASEGRDELIAAFNPLPRPAKALVLRGGRAAALYIPPLSAASSSPEGLKDLGKGVEGFDDGECLVLRNDVLEVRVRKRDGSVAGLRDLKLGREFLGEDGVRFEVFEDAPTLGRSTMATPVRYYDYVFDCWEAYHLQRPEGVRFVRLREPRTASLRVGEGFAEAVVTYKTLIGGEPLSLKHVLRLYPNEPWVEGTVNVSWGLKHKMLKLMADLGPWCEALAVGQPYGHSLRRNPASPYSTLFDRAAWEAWFNGWLDYSDGSAGLALICGSRFGYGLMGRSLSLTLMRSPRFPPDMAWDVPWVPELLSKQDFVEGGDYVIRYYIYTHPGDWEVGRVPTVAEDLLEGPHTTVLKGDALQEAGGLISFRATTPVEVPAIKLGEDEDYVVVRLFNPYGVRTSVDVLVGGSRPAAISANLLEEPLGEATLPADLPPHSLRTLVIKL